MDQNYDASEDESGGYLMSVSDMMSGLLLIFIITLVAFIINFQDAIQHQNQVTETRKEIVRTLTNSEYIRNELLNNLKETLKRNNIAVEVDTQNGILRLSEKAVLFKTASDILSQQYISNLKTIGRVLNDILPCYTATPSVEHVCLDIERTKFKINSILIEGHTDNVPMKSSRMKDNWELSANRAIAAYRQLVSNTELESLLNSMHQPIFSVSGYGDGRPVPGHEHTQPTADPVNRRIDLRFIMTPPSLTEPQKELIYKGVR